MNLKKSDKIIAIVGVIILILAAIGLVLYVDSDSDEGDSDNGSEADKLVFDVMSEVSKPQNAVADSENPEFVLKNKILKPATWTGKYTVNHENLKSISVFVDFTDNQAGLLPKILKKLGADKLTVTVMDEEGNEIGIEKITGSNNVTIMKGFGSEISIKTITAKDENNAMLMLEENFTSAEKITIEVQLSLQTGLFGKIRESLLKSDSFELEVTYTYYNYNLVKQMNDGDDDDDDDNSETGTMTYRSLSLPGKH